MLDFKPTLELLLPLWHSVKNFPYLICTFWMTIIFPNHNWPKLEYIVLNKKNEAKNHLVDVFVTFGLQVEARTSFLINLLVICLLRTNPWLWQVTRMRRKRKTIFLRLFFILNLFCSRFTETQKSMFAFCGGFNRFYNQRCTQVENPGEGVAQIFAKIPRGGGSRLSGKIARGVTYFGFYCIFINKSYEVCLRRSYIYPPPSPPPCVHLCQQSKIQWLQNFKIFNWLFVFSWNCYIHNW